MHRDYSHYSGYVAIAIFDDRIEIQSYGRLPIGVTVKQLSGPHRSRPTNPLIAEAFHRTGAVEVWGRGTNRVIEMCKRHNIPPPTFEEQQGFLIVTFKVPMVQETGVTQTTQNATQKIVALVTQNPQITRQKLAEETRISADGIKYHLRQLQKKGALRRIGPDKGGHWEVMK